MDVSSEDPSGTFQRSPPRGLGAGETRNATPPSPNQNAFSLPPTPNFCQSNLVWARALTPRFVPWNLVSFFFFFFLNFCPAKAKANVLWPPAPGREEGGAEGGGSQLYFGEVVTPRGLSSPALPDVLRAWPREAGAVPLAVPARPRAHVERRAQPRTRRPAPRSAAIRVTQRARFPNRVPRRVGAGWLPFWPLP